MMHGATICLSSFEDLYPPGTIDGNQLLLQDAALYFPVHGECGLPPLPVSDGRSFVPLLDAPEQPWKKAAYHVFNRNRGGLVIGHAVRTERYRLVSWRRGWGLDGQQIAVELYDYQEDPHETHNVADDPGYAEIRRRLDELLRDNS